MRQIWEEAEIRAMLASMLDREILDLLDKKKYRKKEVFRTVRDDLLQSGFTRDTDQIMSKWQALKKEWKRVSFILQC